MIAVTAIKHPKPDPGFFDGFGWDHAITLAAAILGALITVGVAVAGYLAAQRSTWRERQAQVYAEALRSVEDYLEGPYRIKRRDGSAEQRQAITTWLSDVKSRHNLYRGLLRLHAPTAVANAYDRFVAAAIDDAGPQMTAAWNQSPTTSDAEVPLGTGFDRTSADAAKVQVISAMDDSLRVRWWRPVR